MSRFSNFLIYQSLIIALILSSALADEPDGYYDSAEGLVKTALQQALHDIIDNHTEYPYSSSSTDVWDILKATDCDPNNSANVILIYTGRSVNAAQEYNNGTGWNREHVWAKSHGDFDDIPSAGTDAHHLRPCDISVNSDRGNLDFDNGGNQHSEATGCYYDADSWEPRDAVKGDIARMMFYMAVRYEGDVSGEPDLELVDYISGNTNNPIFGVLSTLIEWHVADTVDAFERNRNEVIYGFQNNRNPFIDRPYFVDNIWGDPVSVDQENYTITPTPRKFILNPAYPNPFNPSTTFSVQINQSTEMTILVIDLTGKQVAHLDRGLLTPGLYQFNWDGLTAAGSAAASGLYFIVVGNDADFSARKIALIR